MNAGVAFRVGYRLYIYHLDFVVVLLVVLLVVVMEVGQMYQ